MLSQAGSGSAHLYPSIREAEAGALYQVEASLVNSVSSIQNSQGDTIKPCLETKQKNK